MWTRVRQSVLDIFNLVLYCFILQANAFFSSWNMHIQNWIGKNQIKQSIAIHNQTYRMFYIYENWKISKLSHSPSIAIHFPCKHWITIFPMNFSAYKNKNGLFMELTLFECEKWMLFHWRVQRWMKTAQMCYGERWLAASAGLTMTNVHNDGVYLRWKFLCWHVDILFISRNDCFESVTFLFLSIHAEMYFVSLLVFILSTKHNFISKCK